MIVACTSKGTFYKYKEYKLKKNLLCEERFTNLHETESEKKKNNSEKNFPCLYELQHQK